MIAFFKEMLPKMIRYRFAHAGFISPGMPFNLTFSVTNRCQSRCRTCKIWEIPQKSPEKFRDELRLDEIEKVFKSMGHIYIFNMSGGEPFLREDIADIVSLACRLLTPGVIHIPTNAIASVVIEKRIVEILKIVQRIDTAIQLTVKPSLDHIGEKHDEIRGVKGNFDKVITLFNYLKELQGAYPNLHVELGTVISSWNVSDIEEIARFVTGLGSDSYRNEIAEQRSEMFNRNDEITPDADQYEKAIQFFVWQIRTRMKRHSLFQRVTNAFRLVYYDLAVRIMREKRQVIPCYAGISNAHLSPYGDIWACCTQGYEKSMGNLRDFNYNFRDLWNSKQAEEVRLHIRKGRCHCPLANQAYSSILLHPASLARVFYEIVKVHGLPTRRK
jgi:MoaA/NifB/PqqE/SkfB family radical SAM enzyme